MCLAACVGWGGRGGGTLSDTSLTADGLGVPQAVSVSLSLLLVQFASCWLLIWPWLGALQV
jgi:hypothetical protein